MLVYRLENSDGAGFYISSVCVEAGFCSFGAENRPMPYSDGIPDHSIRMTMRFGWQSWHLVRKWMLSYTEPDFGILTDLFDTYLCVYEVPSDAVVCGESQCAFEYSQATLVDKLHARTIDQKEPPDHAR